MDVLNLSLSISDWILLALGLGVILYLLGTKNFNYFSKQNVPFIKPVPFLGNSAPLLFRTLSIADYVLRLYNELKGHAYGGTFSFTQPTIMIRDPELIKTITVKDFDSFTDHGAIITEETDVMWGRGIFNLQGQRWRDMRSILSPAFTSSKMKMMFVLVTECGEQLGNFLEKCCKGYTPDKICNIQKNGDMLVVEVKNLFTRYTNDVIATSAFGVEVDSLRKPSNEFYLMGKDASNFGSTRALIWMAYAFSPKLMKMLNISFIPAKVTAFFRSLVCDTMTTRDREGIVRPDLIQLLMQAKKGTLHDEKTLTNDKKFLHDDDLAAQAFLFFLAGFDSTSTLLCFATHQLATHPDVQTRLQEEVDSTLKECGGSITYEALHNMKYLDMVLSETLRLYPPSAAIDRKCVRSYTIPSDPPFQVQPGDMLWLPIYGLHHDPEYFPDPERFDPERFSDENKHNINPFTYLPFGSGPRICIGSRFALMESKVAMVHMLSRFIFRVVPKTPIPIQLSKKGFNMTVDGGFWIGLEQRKKINV